MTSSALLQHQPVQRAASHGLAHVHGFYRSLGALLNGRPIILSLSLSRLLSARCANGPYFISHHRKAPAFCSPARAASIAGVQRQQIVCSAIARITSSTRLIFLLSGELLPKTFIGCGLDGAGQLVDACYACAPPACDDLPFAVSLVARDCSEVDTALARDPIAACASLGLRPLLPAVFSSILTLQARVALRFTAFSIFGPLRPAELRTGQCLCKVLSRNLIFAFFAKAVSKRAGSSLPVSCEIG